MTSKPQLHAICQAFIQERIDAARTAMQAAQESSSSETKSSAGDKYETGREMANAERDRNAAHMQQAQQLQVELARISPDAACDAVRPGALVTTSLGRFYIGISAGKLAVEGEEYFAVSGAAPVAVALKGLRAGQEVVFNGKPVRVLAVE
ncbi:3-oxoacyl-ACP synthase [Hymenobacter sp. BT770]|uniref:3-oxoacyl-ACP synthase n=1 Tax=Hymenobacter sp. BT770 TaxID=2886942 RepID=UPI001D1087DC|nr:3-oxoacyl-ACP synthase [Hymenobacter sp. BT770]MCC3152611.1 3-oxoacyl-ACP synthase [Hymenobacter sp. BT770]MDO3414684.1 3-oxoacyl-ACP synthase [Hymenobacter sp. BT770]